MRAPHVILAAAAAILALPPAASGGATLRPALQAERAATYADDEVAASAGDTRILWKDLDPVIASRRVLSEDGRETLKHLAQSIVLERLAKENGIAVSDAVVEARFKTLDEQVRASGDSAGIAGMMEKARLSPEEFRKFLRLSFVQETLTRRALGLGEKAEVKGDQQELWMDEALAARGYKEIPPPWPGKIVASGSDFEITLADLVRTLRRRLPPKDLREDCYQLLLIRKIGARMPDLAPGALDRAIEQEIQRRRDDAAADPRNAGISWESRLIAQGYVIDMLRQDPAIRVAALAHLWVDRSNDGESLKRIYEAEREQFDGLYGPAIETSVLFLRGARFRNDLNPRTFEDVEGELRKLAEKIRSADDFQRLARERTEDPLTRETGGGLGWVGSGSERVPPEIRDEVRKVLAKPQPGGAGLDPAVSLVGPVRLPTGSALLWLGERRPAPTWDTMSAHVHRELRKRFLDEVLPRTSLVTAF
ncbi:MAG: peptidylprolyl isomerase [Planctomycetota bacterium]